jgi:thioredoxin-like negative regulator of GroEL
MAPARSLLRVCCAALCLTSPLVGESPQPEQAAAVLEFYRTTSPETIDSGRAAELIQKYRGKEDKLLSKLQHEAAELERLDIAWKFKWLRGTVWRWAPQGSDAAEATFGRDGRFLVADPRCIGGKCTWKTTKATVQVHVGELVYRLNAPATPKSTLSGDVKSGAEDHTVSAEFVRDGEDGQVQELVTKTWDNAVKNKKAVLVNFYSGQKLQNGQHWCGPCVQLAPEFDKAAQELFSDGLTGVMYKVDGNKQDSQRLLQKFGIRSYPTMVVLMEGISVDIYSEAQAASAIADYMRQFLMPPPDYYLTLGVSKDAKASDIKKKFRELSRELHPDTGTNGGDPERFALVTSAYETLSDVDLRSMYDAFGGIKFHRKGMQRNYMQHKGIKLKLYQEEGGAVKAWTATDFQNRDRRKPHVVDFYAPWCGHCQELRPEFHKVALALESKAEFVSIDCDTEGNLCQQMEIRGYPQVRLIWPSKKIEEIYNGDLKEDPIKEWVEDALDSLLVELTPATYAKDGTMYSADLPFKACSSGRCLGGSLNFAGLTMVNDSSTFIAII